MPSRPPTRTSTLLSPDEQWRQTVAYFYHRHRTRVTDWQRVMRHEARFRQWYPHWPVRSEEEVKAWCREARRNEPRPENGALLWVARGTHRVLVPGDVLMVTATNGMNERFGMTGVTSKGARLDDYFLPIVYHDYDHLQLPGDLIGARWDDPAIGRLVADLRASSRRRVGASSPAPLFKSYSRVLDGIDTPGPEPACFGLYKSARLPGDRRTRDYRHYLRFYPDGSVTWNLDFNHQGGGDRPYASEPNPAYKGTQYAETTGTVQRMGERLAFDLHDWRGDLFARYEGEFRRNRLWLRCESAARGMPTGELPYRFHPFDPARAPPPDEASVGVRDA